jgi:hypothetical protein
MDCGEIMSSRPSSAGFTRKTAGLISVRFAIRRSTLKLSVESHFVQAQYTAYFI